MALFVTTSTSKKKQEISPGREHFFCLVSAATITPGGCFASGISLGTARLGRISQDFVGFFSFICGKSASYIT